MTSVKKGYRNILIKDLIIAGLIIALPFLFYLYKLAPHTKTWDLKLFVLDSGYWEEVYTYCWLFCVKMLIISCLIIWFITCKHWWRHAILVPLTIELFKLMSFLNNLYTIDETEFIKSLPMTVPVIILLIIITNKLNSYSLSQDLSQELNEEIDDLFSEIKDKEESSIKEIKKKFIILKSKKNNISFEEYMDKLLLLRKELFKL